MHNFFGAKKVVKLYNDTKDHIFLNGQKIATINNDNLAYYILSDHLGSSSILLDSNGQIAQVSDYTPFGSSAYTTTSTELNNDYEFTEKEKDEESTLQYFGARYMDNNIGRFVSVDPVALVFHDGNQLKAITGQKLQQILSDPQSLNSYIYSRNNPIILIDADGNWWKEFIWGNISTLGNGQSWSSFQTELGQAANQLYSDSGAWKAAMDHPYATGAVGGIGTGLVAGAVGATTSALIPMSMLNLCIVGCMKIDKAISLINNSKNVLSGNQISQITNLMQNSKLQSVFNRLYQTTDTLPGGTAGVINFELGTGQLLSPQGHIQKGIELTTALTKILSNQNLSSIDRSIGQTLLNQLQKVITY